MILLKNCSLDIQSAITLTISDVDECSTSNGGCGEDSECINMDGSFICAVMCKDGYRRSGDGQKCIGKYHLILRNRVVLCHMTYFYPMRIRL
jgi:hypothetical protein